MKNKTHKLIQKSIFLILLGIFFNILSSFSAKNKVYAACLNVPVGGSYTISSSCTFADTVDGVDNGGIIINADKTLTVNTGQTIVWSPGESIVVNGSIAIANGGQLKQTNLWLTDADADGYPASSTQVAQTDAPAGGRRRKDISNGTNSSFTYVSDITEFDYDDSNDSIYYGTTCNGDCSTNNSSGECVAVSAGENGLAVCKRCNGSSLTSVNIADNTQDTEGSNLCNQTCKNCNGSGSCVNQSPGEDLFDDCSEVTCANYIYGWSGNDCKVYGSSSNNGDCNGSGACYTSVADSCSGVGATSAGCGSSGCKKACEANDDATNYDTVSEVCYTSDQHSCDPGDICNASGACEEETCTDCVCSGTGYESCSGYYVDCNADKCWSPTAGSTYNWSNAISYCSGLSSGGFSDQIGRAHV